MIHCFTVNGRHMVLDVASGAVHSIDGLAYKILRQWPELPAGCGAEEAEEVLVEIRQLIDEGLLFSKEDTSDAVRVMRGREPVVKALCLHIAHECNLRCAYCFAGQGTYGGGQGMMSAETGKKAIDFLIKHSGRRRNLEVDFFGGEPALNLSAVKAIVIYARERERETNKHFRFTLTTNGTLLDDETNRFLNENMDNVVLSIDGRPEIHDRMRKNADGTGGYKRILPGLLALAESRNHENYFVRGTYTGYNTDFSQDVLHLADAGFTRVSVEPVVSPADRPYAIKPEDVPALCGEYERLAAAMAERRKAGKPFSFFHFEIDLDGGPCTAKRLTGCGAGTEYLAVTPGGSLYPCHQFVGDSAWQVGHLDTGITAPDICERFAALNVLEKEECAGCWARYYCGGGCAANAWHRNGDLSAPDETGCILERKRVECALYLHAESRQD